ncbi:PEP-CTERM protein-sorting domain-containing protein [Marinobacter sp. es.048]|uniref:PEP-CTERM sorting domain-containing protein n=1 Tax=Marinobacter sp. es.048 TaxID=1761795 RepID=UPI000B58E375|nr:PEP-CTERM sorting domain-containing protein [Marinobacter sp. es.048]SNC74375.1 PEP-CTERM protein-sorting domain-containing protein [Marinobacter sp. es.048]
MNNRKMLKAWSAGILLSTASTFASATPVTMDLDYTGFPEGYQGGTITNDGNATNVRAGMFRFSVSNLQGTSPFPLSADDVIDAFCVDIDTYLDTTNTISYSLEDAGTYFGDANKVDQIGRLYTGFESLVSGADRSAAFQLALWEIINEDAGSLDLSNGSFSSSAFDSARGIGEGWLGSLNGFENNYQLYVLSSELLESNGGLEKKSQDLLVFSPKPPVKVPEPGTLALLALGIFGLVLRKKAGPKKN